VPLFLAFFILSASLIASEDYPEKHQYPRVSKETQLFDQEITKGKIQERGAQVYARLHSSLCRK